MKYIITESQYNKTIDKFITYQFEPHEEKRTKNKPNSRLISTIDMNSASFWMKSFITSSLMSIGSQ